jgi:hypothetical protein
MMQDLQQVGKRVFLAITGRGKPKKEMNPVTAATLTTGLVWTDMCDAMLVRAHQG